MDFDAHDTQCHVYTYKEGLLARAAHDLKLRVHELSMSIDDDRVVATFDAASLQVVTAMKRGAEAPRALSDRDRRQAEQNVRTAVLHPEQYPEIRFESDSREPLADGWLVSGQLTLHGVTRPLKCEVRRRGDRWTTRVRLHQPDYGITPFTALLGTLRIKPHIDIEVSAPGSALP